MSIWPFSITCYYKKCSKIKYSCTRATHVQVYRWRKLTGAGGGSEVCTSVSWWLAAKSAHMELVSVCVSSSDVRGLSSHSFSNTACSRVLGCVPICWGENMPPLPTFNLHLGRYGVCFNLFSCVWEFFFFLLHIVLVKMTFLILCFSISRYFPRMPGPHLTQNAPVLILPRMLWFLF